MVKTHANTEYYNCNNYKNNNNNYYYYQYSCYYTALPTFCTSVLPPINIDIPRSIVDTTISLH